ncbi:MAG: prepilin-type N-terminal cleavage/methylation domain-containing protein [Thermodesulfovibrionales bacterium]|nr:prepilin-type N-terminal cleavage/methylation domain-containing protein [Thermodesulfovibrionales bacterium]
MRETLIHKEHGFTLIEMLAVLFVLALVAAVIMPGFSSPRDTLRKESGTLSSTIRSLYETTVSKKVSGRIEFDLDSRGVQWTAGSNNGSAVFSTLSGVELPTRGLVKEGRLIIFMSPSGNNEHMTVYLEHGGERMTVGFNPISGRTRVNGPFTDQ